MPPWHDETRDRSQDEKNRSDKKTIFSVLKLE